MAGARRRDRTEQTRTAWLTQAFLAHHAGRLAPGELRRTIQQVRRHADTIAVLDESAPARTRLPLHPE